MLQNEISKENASQPNSQPNMVLISPEIYQVAWNPSRERGLEIKSDEMSQAINLDKKGFYCQ